jgi:acyl transferase domain-containing protein
VTSIAVVGIDCRFPGAPDKNAYWRLLMDGVVTDTEVPSQRWDVDAYYHPDGVAGSMNTRRGHFIDDVDAFDNDLFGIAPIEAAALDPQQRLLLQTSWRALEDGGIDPRSLAGTPTGVFVGMMSSEWTSLQMFDYPAVTAFRGAGSGYFMAANRISYHLNLTGPSMAVDSACSSSLMAVHQACVALRSGETDTAIAAGANLLLTPSLSIFYTQAGLSAPDGRCKPFGQGADGIGRGEGVAAVVLRRLDDAIADDQPIYAVVKSSVANHDGRSNGITAPNRRSQVDLMRRALTLAEVEAGQIGFVEAHGTGTFLGDMIEANALGDVHKTRGGEPCLLGSVKGNIGHTEGSAGIAAFIKACLALHHHVLPPTVFGDSANAGLRLDAHGLRLADSAQPLPAHGALGGVSSFGLGGSNAHAVLESAPAVAQPDPGAAGVITLSAPSEEALRRNAGSIATALDNLDDQQLASWCRTTNVVKRSQRHRLVLEGNRGSLVDGLREYLAGDRPDLASFVPASKVPAAVGLLCSGQGTQYPGMTQPLYDANPIYREHLDAAAAALDPHLPSDLFAAIFGGDPDLNHTSLAQPALFAVSYALGKTLLQSGIRPTFGIGHSVGELAAACLAGVLSVDDAAWLVAVRGRLMGSLPPGGAMIAVDLTVEQAEALIADDPGCAIAAVNGPCSVVISGAADALGRAEAAVRAQGGKAVNLAVSHAFHSPLMEPIVAEFRRELSGLTPGPAEFRIFSTVLGREVEGHEMDADYWTSQICSPVRFFDAVRAAVSAATTDYVAEVGPRSTLLTMARKCGLSAQTRSLTLCGGPDSHGTELLAVAATMLRDGYAPDLSPLYGRPAGPLRRIPPYVFDTSSRFWFDGRVAAGVPTARPAVVTPIAEPRQPAKAPDSVPNPVPNSSEGAVLGVIADVGGYSVGEIARTSRLSDDLGYDSLLQLRILDRLRAQYPELGRVPIVELVPKIHTVGDIVDFVVERLGPAADVTR